LIISGSSAEVGSSKSMILGCIASAARDRDALLLAAERSRDSFPPCPGCGPARGARARARRVGLAEASHPDGRQHDVLEPVHVREQVKRLEDHPDARSQGREADAGPGERLAEHDELATLDGLERIHAPDEVLLPEPDGPQTTTTSPVFTARVMSRRTWAFPNHLLTDVKLDHRVGHQLITTRTPAITVWPGPTRASATAPGPSPQLVVLHLHASITRIVSPTATTSPAGPRMWVILPGSGAVTVWGRSPPRRPRSG